MLENLKKQNFGETAMITAYGISVFKNLVDSSTLFKNMTVLTNFILIFFFALLIYKFFIQKYTYYSLICIIVISLVVLYSAIATGYNTIFYGFLFVFALQNVEIKKLIKVGLAIKLTFLSISIIYYMLVLYFMPGSIELFTRNGISRHAFFLNHPNSFTAFLTWSLLEIFFLLYDKLKAIHMIIIWLISFIFYLMTNSNSGTLILSFVILLICLEKKHFLVAIKIINFFAKFGFAFFTVLFLGIAFAYPYINGMVLNGWNAMNEWMTGRLMYGAYSFDMEGITLLGRQAFFGEQVVLWRGNWIDSIYFDNTYYQFWFSTGALILFIISFVLMTHSKYMKCEEKIMIAALALYGIMENYCVNVFMCFPLIILGKYLFKVKESNDVKVFALLNQCKEMPLWMKK